MSDTWRTERALWLLLFFLQATLFGILLLIIVQSSPLDSTTAFSDKGNPRNSFAEYLASNNQALDLGQQKILVNNCSRLQKSFDEYQQFISRGHKTLRELYIVLLLVVVCSVVLEIGILFYHLRCKRQSQ